MNLSNLSVADLRSLQDQIAQEIKKREQQEVIKAREQILAIAHSVGIPLKELVGGNVRIRTSVPNKVAVRFQHPENATLKWTGRGRQPVWVKDWIAAGQSLDALRV